MDDGTTRSEDAREPLLEQAADWLVLLTSGRATQADAEALAVWREADPTHDAAFRQVATLTGLTRILAEHPAPRVGRRAVIAGGAGLAVALGAFGMARPPLGLWPSYAELMADHRTGPGERYAFAPVAGVSVEMNSRTSVSLARDGRALRLIGGEAFVAVRDRLDGYAVQAGRLRATANAAVFNVQAIDGTVGIVCVEGHLRCSAGDRAIALDAGERLTLREDGTLQRSAANARAATAWRKGLLVFEGDPLAEVVRQINRYRAGDIVLTDAEIARRPVNAVFHTAQIDNAVGQIQQLLGLTVRRLPGGVILMG